MKKTVLRQNDWMMKWACCLAIFVLFSFMDCLPTLAETTTIRAENGDVAAEQTAISEVLPTDQPAGGSGNAVGETMVVQPEAPAAVPGLIASDVPNDSGGTIKLSWEWPDGVERPDQFAIERRVDGEQDWESIATIDGGNNDFEDNTTTDDVNYQYRIGSQGNNLTTWTVASDLIVSTDHWFNWTRLNVLVCSAIICFFIILFIQIARSGRELFVRRIAGLSAVEEAIGRATEMGRPILFVPGTGYIEDVATVAALNMLGEITRRIVNYNVRLICPNMEPIVYTVAREIVKEAYSAEGRPEYYNPDSVFFVVNNQFAFAAAVDGIMMREKPATNFFMGYFNAESLIMAETGAMTGAIQLAGTDSISQLPFFITACDYTLIGEELYASSAYLSRNPLLLGTLKGQDYSKLVIILALIVVTILNLIWPDLGVVGFFQTGGS